MNRNIVAGTLGAAVALGQLGLAAGAPAQHMGNLGDEG